MRWRSRQALFSEKVITLAPSRDIFLASVQTCKLAKCNSNSNNIFVYLFRKKTSFQSNLVTTLILIYVVFIVGMYVVCTNYVSTYIVLCTYLPTHGF